MFGLKHVYTSSLSFHLGYWSSTVEQSMFFILLFFLQHCFTLGHRFYRKAQLHSLHPPSLSLCHTHIHAHTHTHTQSCYVSHWRPNLLLDTKNQVARTYTWLYRTLSFAVSLTCSHTHSLIHPPNRMRVGFGGGGAWQDCTVLVLTGCPFTLAILALPPSLSPRHLTLSLPLSVCLLLFALQQIVVFFYPTSSCIFDKQNMIALQRKENNEWLELESLFSHLLLPFQRKEKDLQKCKQERVCLLQSLPLPVLSVSHSKILR